MADAISNDATSRAHGALNEAAIAQAYANFLAANPAAARKLAKSWGSMCSPSRKSAKRTYPSQGATGVGVGIVNWMVDNTGYDD